MGSWAWARSQAKSDCSCREEGLFPCPFCSSCSKSKSSRRNKKPNPGIPEPSVTNCGYFQPPAVTNLTPSRPFISTSKTVATVTIGWTPIPACATCIRAAVAFHLPAPLPTPIRIGRRCAQYAHKKGVSQATGLLFDIGVPAKPQLAVCLREQVPGILSQLVRSRSSDLRQLVAEIVDQEMAHDAKAAR